MSGQAVSGSAEAPFWLEAMRMAAENPLMCDMQIVPIVNEGTIKAVYDHIVALTQRLADETLRANYEAGIAEDAIAHAERANAERDAARKNAERWGYVADNYGWYRDGKVVGRDPITEEPITEDFTSVQVTIPGEPNLNCRAMLEHAIDAAIAARKAEGGTPHA